MCVISWRVTGNNPTADEGEHDGAKPYLLGASLFVLLVVIGILASGALLGVAPWAVFSAGLPLVVAVMALTIPRRPHGYDFTSTTKGIARLGEWKRSDLCASSTPACSSTR